MEKIPKLKEYSKKEIKRQFTNGEIDTDFMCEYISTRDKVYNQLVDEVNDLKKDISFCLKSIKQEMEMSTDSRTKKEMSSCYEILSRWEDE